VDDLDYKKAKAIRWAKRNGWMIFQSLKATEGLEWDLVKEEDPESWVKVDEEFKAAKFSEYEIGRIYNGVMAANCLDERRVEEARKSFLATAQVQPAS